MEKKSILLVVLVVLLCLPAMADEAVFKTVNGTVEYRVSTDSQWQKASKGIFIPEGSDISTGFKSSSAILANGSIIMVKALTRMSLDQIVKTDTGATTGLYLLSGKVQVEVKPGANTETTEFKIKSPMATASVRGTGFIFDGQNILVKHGRVELKNKYGVNRDVNGGQFAAVSNQGDVSKAIPVLLPSTPLITADGGEEEIENAVLSLDPLAVPTSEGEPAGEGEPASEQVAVSVQKPVIQVDTNFQDIKSTYSNAITAPNIQQATEITAEVKTTASTITKSALTIKIK